MELRSQHDTTEVQELHEARVRHLEELLKTTRRERDEFKDQYMQLKGRLLSNSRCMASGVTQDPQLAARSGLSPLESAASISGLTQEPQSRTRSGLQPLESVSSVLEPSRKSQLEYVKSMSKPTRDTLTEVHRKMQEQQKRQQLEIQQLDMQQLQQHHHMDLQHQHSSHSQLDLRPFQSKQQHQLEELRQHFEIQQKDHSPGQPLHMDMVINDRQSDVSHSGDVDNGSDAKNATWNEFSSSVLDIHSSNEQCLILDSPEHMHITQGLSTQVLPTPHVDQRSSPSSHLDDLQQQLQQHQQHHHQDDNMHMHLHHQQQESEEILSHMQQSQTPDAHGLHLQDEQKLRRQLSKRKLQDALAPISGGLQATNDVVMSMAAIPQHSTGGLQGTNGISQHSAGGLQGTNIIPQHSAGGLQRTNVISQHSAGGFQGTNDVVMSMGVMQQAVIPQHSSGGLQGTNVISQHAAGGLQVTNVISQHTAGGLQVTNVISQHSSGGLQGTNVISQHTAGGLQGTNVISQHSSGGLQGTTNVIPQHSSGGLQGTNVMAKHSSGGLQRTNVIPERSTGGLQGTNDVVMSMGVNVLPPHSSPWPVGLMDLTPPPLPNGTNGISEQLLQGCCLQGSSVVASILSPLGDSSSNSMRLARHLPEPPEADPQVMLSSLPEKGFLLDAVMNAGPLLQTLMLAGPLPQWRHPPPPLDAEEIPKVSIRAPVGMMAPGAEQGIGLIPSHGRSLEQVMRLSASVQPSPTQNGFCH